MQEKPKIKKKRRARTKNHYFTKVHEDAIVKYANTNDIDLRTKLYIEFIQPAFDQMVDKIIYTYRFTTLPNIDYLKEDCKIRGHRRRRSAYKVVYRIHPARI